MGRVRGGAAVSFSAEEELSARWFGSPEALTPETLMASSTEAVSTPAIADHPVRAARITSSSGEPEIASRLTAQTARPHLGGPLNKGIVVGATIRCPWHHACFDLETEEATAAPAFDALLEYPVTIDDNRFSAKPASAQIFRRIGRHEVSLGTMAIVGGGAAGFAAADAIRKIGWRGG